jgi:hypothetical protein
MEGRIETNGNEEEGEKEKEALRKQYEVRRGTPNASPLIFGPHFAGCECMPGGRKPA